MPKKQIKNKRQKLKNKTLGNLNDQLPAVNLSKNELEIENYSREMNT
jgi:hypothetical protein